MKLPIVLDGATGSNLSLNGMPAGVCPEKWTLENPEIIIKIQSDFISAGSDILYAPTFGANREKLSRFGLGDSVNEYCRRLVSLSREAADGRMVAGDMTSLGLFTVPIGSATFESLYDIYFEQAKSLSDAGVDLFILETMTNLSEARAAFLAVKAVSDKPVFITFSCEESGKTFNGVDIRAALVIFESMGADAFGLNCSSGPEMLLKNMKLLSSFAKVPLIAKPNAGLPEIIDGKTVFKSSPEEFSSYTREFAEAGVGIFGGCCGTEAPHIKALKDSLAGITAKNNSADISDIAADEHSIFGSIDTSLIGSLINAGEDLSEDISDCEDDILSIFIPSAEALSYFEENQYLIRIPLALSAASTELLEKALRIYNGRAFIHSGKDSDRLSRLYGSIPY